MSHPAGEVWAGVRFVPLEDHLWADARGWGLQPLAPRGPDRERLGGVHVVSVEPGAVRGNHLHPDTTEWLLLFGAPVTFAWRAPGGDVESRLVTGEPVLAEIGPGVAHALRGEGPGTAFLVSWADGTPETERVEPILAP